LDAALDGVPSLVGDRAAGEVGDEAQLCMQIFVDPHTKRLIALLFFSLCGL
jgi:hypothetical protein